MGKKKKKKTFIWLQQYNIIQMTIKQISRATLSENPEVNHAGHLNIQFLDYHETTTTILL